MFSYYPQPKASPAMQFCQGGHVMEPGAETFQRGDGLYCATHVPEPPYKWTARDINRLGFAKWRRQHGHFDDDDHGETLTESERARLSRHVLP